MQVVARTRSNGNAVPEIGAGGEDEIEWRICA